MKIRITKSALVEALGTVKDACEGKDALNILRCVKLATDGNGITLTASNLGITAVTRAECEVAEKGEVALVGSSLFAFSGALDEGVIEIEHKEGLPMATISRGSCRYKLAVGDINQWPSMAVIGDGGAKVTSVTLGAVVLRELFRKTAYAASTAIDRKMLNGVNLSVKDGKLTAVATDGRRLSCCEVEVDKADEGGCTITSKTVQILLKTMRREDGDIEIVTDGRQAAFMEADGKWSIQAKIIDGVYPNWRQVIPKESVNEIALERETFNDELERVALSAKTIGNDRFVKVTIADGKLVMESTDGDYSKAKTEMAVKYAGERIVTSINPSLVKDILGCVDEDEIRIAWGNGTVPIVFRAQIPFVGVVMPMREY